MNLNPEEVKQFYSIWFPLLHFVNQRQKLISLFPKSWQSVPIEDVLPLREALWDNTSLLDDFVAENPANLSSSELSLAQSWKYRVTGSFFIFRYLKNYTVFLNSDSPAKAYAVLGLVSPIEDVVPAALPVYVQTVLIPFKDKIIYDSLIAPYPVFFGGGIRQSLNDTYRRIAEREGIITTLLPRTEEDEQEHIQKSVQESHKKILRAFQKNLGQSGLSPKKIEEHTQNIEDFAYNFLAENSPSKYLMDINLSDINNYLRTQKKKAFTVSFKRFLRFLRDTGRMDYGKALDLLEALKSR